jgi:hypothetical protein
LHCFRWAEFFAFSSEAHEYHEIGVICQLSLAKSRSDSRKLQGVSALITSGACAKRTFHRA